MMIEKSSHALLLAVNLLLCMNVLGSNRNDSCVSKTCLASTAVYCAVHTALTAGALTNVQDPQNVLMYGAAGACLDATMLCCSGRSGGIKERCRQIAKECKDIFGSDSHHHPCMPCVAAALIGGAKFYLQMQAMNSMLVSSGNMER